MSHQTVDTSGVEVPGQGRRPEAPRDGTERQFLGRIQELKSLRADTEGAGLNTLAGRKAPRARVLLIVGRPGSGRTALAEEFARQVADRYPDVVLRAGLTGADGRPAPLAGVARALLGALDAPATPGADEDDLTGELRDALAARRVLLLLDGAADAEHVDLLVPNAPDSLVVAVSEGPLTGIPDVRPCTIGGLDTASAVQLLGRYTGSVRITCDPGAADQLVEECGRLPAAVVLAGGWLAARPRAAVADLARRLAAQPVAADGSALARVFFLVHADLPGPLARMWRLLGATPAGLADPHTASALAGCSVPDAHAALDDLAARGLLHRLDSPLPQYVVPGCLLPLLHPLTEAQHRPAELQLARARLLERTVSLLGSCRAAAEPAVGAARRKAAELPAALRFPSATAARRWLEIRQPALLAAAEAAVADGGLDTLARRLMAALVRALVAHRGTQAAAAELYGIHQLVLSVAERRGLHREQAAALLNIADLDARTGRTRAALARYRAALDAGRRADDPYAAGRAMESLGGAHQELGDWQRAADWFARALTQRLARDERADAARLYGRMAAAQSLGGRYPEALRSWRAAVAGHRKAGDLAGQARAMSEMARVQEYAGQYEESLRTCREAVQWARHARDERLQAALQLRLADAFARLGDPEAARLHRQAAERMLGRELTGAADVRATREAAPEAAPEPLPGTVRDAAQEPSGPGGARDVQQPSGGPGAGIGSVRRADGVEGPEAAEAAEASAGTAEAAEAAGTAEAAEPSAELLAGSVARAPLRPGICEPGAAERRTPRAWAPDAQAPEPHTPEAEQATPASRPAPDTPGTSEPEPHGTLDDHGTSEPLAATQASRAPDPDAPAAPDPAQAEPGGGPGIPAAVAPAGQGGDAPGAVRPPRPDVPHVPGPAVGERDPEEHCRP